MGKRFRIWLMRIVAIVIVLFMVIELGANIFNTNDSNSNQDTNDKTTQTAKKNKSQYAFVSASNTVKLEGIDQTILLPEGMTKQSEEKNDETGAIIYNYGSQEFNGVTIGLIISEMESSKGANFDNVTMTSMEDYAEGLKNGEYENTNYITFKGESNLFLEEVQTIYDADHSNVQYKYEVDYNIFDIDNSNYYVISLFLVSPENPTKTDDLKVDRLGREMLSKTRFANMDVYQEYGLPANDDDQFNHIN